MIELTQEKLNELLTDFNLGSVGYIIITKQIWDNYDDTLPIAYYNGMSNFNNIIAFKCDDLYFADNISNLQPWASLKDMNNIIDDELGEIYIDSRAKISEPLYVIYGMNDTDGEYVFGLDNERYVNSPLVSVDFIGNELEGIKFYGPYDNLKEINLANNSDSSNNIASVYNNLLIYKNDQFVYNGNFNSITLTPGAFGNSPIKKFVFPKTTTNYTIPANCFAGCSDLQEVVIPSCVTSIGAGAFKGCVSLTSIEIPDSVTSIGANAFNGCTGLEYVKIDSSAVTIADSAFEGCTKPMLEFDVSTNNDVYYGDCGGLYAKTTSLYGSDYIELVHATKACFDDSITQGTGKFHVIRGDRLPIGYYTNFDITYGIFTDVISGGTASLYDADDGTVHNGLTMITPSNRDQVRSSYPYANNAHFFIPLYQTVNKIRPRACFGDLNITSIDLSFSNNHTWYMLDTIGSEAFKGCKSLVTFKATNYWNQEGLTKIERIDIYDSAFEGCTNLINVDIPNNVSLGTKAFFGCISLQHLHLLRSPGFLPNSSMWFGNTPSLTSITAYPSEIQTNNLTIVYNGNTPANAIVGKTTQSGDYDMIVVGCSATDFNGVVTKYPTAINIGDYAFYGCTQLTVDNTNNFNRARSIGNSAFYSCTSLNNNVAGTEGVNLSNVDTIGSNAFYGCTSLKSLYTQHAVTIGSKAFANSGIINVDMAGDIITSMPDDVFDGCNITNFKVDGSSANTLVRTSAINSENSFLKGSNDNQVSLIKSADGKQMINTDTYTGKLVKEIKSGAFSGVNMNSDNYASNHNIYIPSTVNILGSNILAGSKMDGITGNGQGTLYLDTASQYSDNCMSCNGQSNGLILFICAKYFKNLVSNTYQNRLNSYTYYKITRITGLDYGVKLVEVSGTRLDTEIVLASFSYNENNDLVARINYIPTPIYDAPDTHTHVIQLTEELTITLLYGGQVLTPAEQAVYGDSEFAPGQRVPYLLPRDGWTNNEVPSDVVTLNAWHNYSPYSGQTGTFSNCQWIGNVVSGRRIGNLAGAFKGCTYLSTIKSQSAAGNIDYNIFDGTVPSDMFNGCTSFTGIVASQPTNKFIMPIVYSSGAFSGTNLGGDIMIPFTTYGTDFGKNSFNGIRSIELNFNSALNIDPEAFKDCNNLRILKAENTCGEYFNLETQAICNKNLNIVIGIKGADLNLYNGVGKYAFSGRTYPGNWVLTLNNKNGFIIDESAFSNTSVTQYVESGTTQSTQIGKSSFKDCKKLTAVTFGPMVTLSESSFEGCTVLSSLTLPVTSSAVDIPKSCFAKCTTLTSVTLNGNVSENAFSGCTSLETLTLYYSSNSNATINGSAFSGCPIHTISVADNYSPETSKYMFKTRGNGNGIYLKENESDNDFELVIGTDAFEIPIIPDNDSDDVIFKVLRVIGKHAFNGRGLQGEITIPASVTKINDYAFANNPQITYVNIPPTVEYIGAHAFDGCTNLRRVTLPDSCKFIGDSAFNGCDLAEGFNCNTLDERYHITNGTALNPLERIDIEYLGSLDLTNAKVFNAIGANAFAGTNIKSVKLPITCGTLSAGAFYGCTNLTELHVNSTTLNLLPGSPDSSTCLYGCSNLCDIYFHSLCTITGTITQNAGIGTSQTHHKYIHVKPTQNLNNSFITGLRDYFGFEVKYDA